MPRQPAASRPRYRRHQLGSPPLIGPLAVTQPGVDEGHPHVEVGSQADRRAAAPSRSPGRGRAAGRPAPSAPRWPRHRSRSCRRRSRRRAGAVADRRRGSPLACSTATACSGDSSVPRAVRHADPAARRQRATRPFPRLRLDESAPDEPGDGGRAVSAGDLRTGESIRSGGELLERRELARTQRPAGRSLPPSKESGGRATCVGQLAANVRTAGRPMRRAASSRGRPARGRRASAGAAGDRRARRAPRARGPVVLPTRAARAGRGRPRPRPRGHVAVGADGVSSATSSSRSSSRAAASSG